MLSAIKKSNCYYNFFIIIFLKKNIVVEDLNTTITTTYLHSEKITIFFFPMCDKKKYELYAATIYICFIGLPFPNKMPSLKSSTQDKGWLNVIPKPCRISVHMNMDNSMGTGIIMVAGRTSVKEIFSESCKMDGVIDINPKNGYVVEHDGIVMTFIGELELAPKKGKHSINEFISETVTVSQAGVLKEGQRFTYNFPSVFSPYDSYSGQRLAVKYYLRVTIKRKLVPNVVHSQEVWVRCSQSQLSPSLCPSLLAKSNGNSLWKAPYRIYGNANRRSIVHSTETTDDQITSNSSEEALLSGGTESDVSQKNNFTRYRTEISECPIQLSICLQDRVNVSLSFERNVYHTKDVVRGAIAFSRLDNFNLTVAQLQLLRKEISEGNTLTTETLFTSELLDGAPRCDDPIPLSFPLRGIKTLTPSLFSVIEKASVRHYLQLILFDGDEPHIAEAEIYIWRAPDREESIAGP